MYCSSCGSAVTPGLSYCNRCGAETSAKKPAANKESSLPESLVWAILGVSVGGLGVLIGLMAVMKNELHFDNQMILIILLLSFALLLAAESVFIWMLLNTVRRRNRREKEAVETVRVKGVATKELGEPPERLLVAPAASVTEEATRTLEPVYRERK